MEGDDQQRRQYEQSGYPLGRGYGQTPRRGSGSSVSDRFRQSQMPSLRSPTSAPRTSVGGQGAGMGVYGYTQGQQQYTPQLQDSSLQYQPDFSQDPQRSAQFPSYTSNLMYNLPQQTQQPTAYDPVQQYQPRQSAAIEVLSNQFGVPQYFSPTESASAPGAVPQQFATTSFQQQMTYQQPAQAGRATLPSSYPTTMADYTQSAIHGLLEQPQPDPTTQEAAGFDAAYNEYLEALKRTFQHTREGRMVEAGQSLMQISDWLLGQAGDLGLTKDDQELHAERMKLWNDFNTCWLAVLQRQKDITQEMIASGRAPPPPQSIMQEEALERMGRDLVRHCDGMERHGLVDYEMGVWEEEIMSILIDCLDLLEGDEDVGEPEAGAQDLPPTLGSNTR